jgi:hypothetical protein
MGQQNPFQSIAEGLVFLPLKSLLYLAAHIVP